MFLSMFSNVLFRSYVSTKSGYLLVQLSRFYGNNFFLNNSNSNSNNNKISKLLCTYGWRCWAGAAAAAGWGLGARSSPRARAGGCGCVCRCVGRGWMSRRQPRGGLW